MLDEDGGMVILHEELGRESGCGLSLLRLQILNGKLTLELHHVDVREVVHEDRNIGVEGFPLLIAHRRLLHRELPTKIKTAIDISSEHLCTGSVLMHFDLEIFIRRVIDNKVLELLDSEIRVNTENDYLVKCGVQNVGEITQDRSLQLEETVRGSHFLLSVYISELLLYLWHGHYLRRVI